MFSQLVETLWLQQLYQAMVRKNIKIIVLLYVKWTDYSQELQIKLRLWLSNVCTQILANHCIYQKIPFGSELIFLDATKRLL